CCLQLLKMRPQAVIDDPVADADHEPSDDGRIAANRGLDVAAELLAQRIPDVLLEPSVRRYGGRDLDTDDARRPVCHGVVVAEDLACDADTAAFDEQPREVASL